MKFTPRLINPPFRVFWAGFSATSLELQSKGWTLSIEQRPDRRRMRLALTMQGNIYSMSSLVEYDFFQQNYPLEIPINFSLDYFAENININYSSPMDNYWLGTWTQVPINGPKVIKDFKPQSIEDFNIFQNDVNPYDLIVDPSEVTNLLEKIESLQEPERQRIKKAEKITKKTHARIITLEEV